MSAVLSPLSVGLRADFSERAAVIPGEVGWTRAPGDGVHRLRLDRVGDEVARATSYVRYEPGSHFARHVHGGGEEILVLAGVFPDERGDFPAGTYLRNPPGSAHAPHSREGCTLFVKLWQFSPGDDTTLVLDTREQQWLRDASGQSSRMPLHAFAGIETRLLHWRPGIGGAPVQHPGGVEMVVLDGDFTDENGHYPAGAWLRLPRGAWHRPRAGRRGALMWIKTGHLGAPSLADRLGAAADADSAAQ